MARSVWRENLHPRDSFGRFKSTAGRRSRGKPVKYKGRTATRSQRAARGIVTGAQLTVAAGVGGVVGRTAGGTAGFVLSGGNPLGALAGQQAGQIAGAQIASYVVRNRRRNVQVRRGDTGLRNTLTGRRLN